MKAATALPGSTPEMFESEDRSTCSQAAEHRADHTSELVSSEATHCTTACSFEDNSHDDFIDVDARSLVLEFCHECRYIGCNQFGCRVCVDSVQRRCPKSLFPKTVVDTVLKSKCGAEISVQVRDVESGEVVRQDLPDVHLQMCILDGPLFDAQSAARITSGCLSAAELESLMRQTFKRDDVYLPLLAPGADSAAFQADDQAVHTPLRRGFARLPDLTVKQSSAAVLKSKDPTFRLLVRAVDSQDQPVNIRPAISNGFVVVTRRAKSDAKADIPSFQDSVRKLSNIGKESAKKLENLLEAGVTCAAPINRIETVGQFRALILQADEQPELKEQLKVALQLKHQWEAMKEHLARAVQPRLVLRTWFPVDAACGLLFWPEDGKRDAFEPIDMIVRSPDGSLPKFRRASRFVLEPARQKAALRTMMGLKRQAEACWWSRGHPGWANTSCSSADEIPFVQTFPEDIIRRAACVLPQLGGVRCGDLKRPAARDVVLEQPMPQQKRRRSARNAHQLGMSGTLQTLNIPSGDLGSRETAAFTRTHFELPAETLTAPGCTNFAGNLFQPPAKGPKEGCNPLALMPNVNSHMLQTLGLPSPNAISGSSSQPASQSNRSNSVWSLQSSPERVPTWCECAALCSPGEAAGTGHANRSGPQTAASGSFWPQQMAAQEPDVMPLALAETLPKLANPPAWAMPDASDVWQLLKASEGSRLPSDSFCGGFLQSSLAPSSAGVQMSQVPGPGAPEMLFVPGDMPEPYSPNDGQVRVLDKDAAEELSSEHATLLEMLQPLCQDFDLGVE